MWTVPFIHWQIGGAFVIMVVTALVGVLAYIACRIQNPAFFRKETLTRSTETLVPGPLSHFRPSRGPSVGASAYAGAVTRPR